MKMRVLLAISFLLNSQSISGEKNVAINVPCNKELDGLLAADPDGNENAFMSCQGVGVGTIGFWERKVCPNNMVFDFINQMCKARGKKSRKQQTLNIAILNNSCANGETCIGGSTCDSDSLKCMCPYGTVPQLDTLSCETAEMSFVSPPVENSRFSFNAFSGLEKSPMNGGFSTNNFNGPPPNTFQPNPVFKFSNNRVNNNFGLGNNQNNNNNNNNNNNFNWNPDFNFKPNWNNGVFTGSNNNDQSNYGNPFQPNPVQKFIYNVNNPNPAQSSSSNNNNNNQNNNFGQSATTPKKVTTLARPGDSCRANELCVGGSICTLPIGLCLCPGDLEERDGECVLPAAAALKIIKVGIGALCSDLAECDNGSTCVMGRCACLSPLVQHEGKCVLRQQQKHVGPGELCDNGEICSKGSVCDAVIPVCVCPSDTDLNDGECQRIQSSHQTSAVETTTQPIYRPPPQPVFTVPPPSQPEPSPRTFPQPQPTYTYNQYTTRQPLPPTIYQTTPAPRPVFVATNPPTAPPAAINYKSIFTVPPKPVQTQKPNHMKISLGGSKQAGVGVRCALNTDCMIGAYCNGNTNPPSCQCLSTHVNIEGRCEKVVYPGQVGCRSDLQCTSAYTGTSCIDRICVCPEGKKAVDQTCVPVSNEPCGSSPTNPCRSDTDDPECRPACIEPLVCVRSVCVCPDGICNSSRPKAVVKRAAVIEHSLTCWPGAEKCSGGDGICIEEKCYCLKGFVEEGDKCQKIALPLDSSCQIGSEPPCVSGATCMGGKCICNQPDGCQFASKRIEERCHTDAHCLNGRLCVSGRCQCPPGMQDLNGECSSQVGAFKNINNQCNPKDRCSGGSKCKDHVCQCVDGSKEHQGKCRQDPGGKCSNGEMCSGGSFCEFGVCRCSQAHVLEGNRCLVALAEPGKSCQQGQKCVHGSVCRFALCMCIGKTIPIKGRCVRREDSVITEKEPKSDLKLSQLKTAGSAKSPGMPCTSSDICTGGSRCDGAYCICSEYEVIINDQCVGTHNQAKAVIDQLSIAAPGQICHARTNCTGGSKCINDLCICEKGTIQPSGICSDEMETTTLTKETSMVPGSFCTLTIECPFRTQCLRGVCRCKSGETIVDGTCRKAINSVLPGASCDPKKGYDCVGESQCLYGVCACTKQMQSNGKECVTSAELSRVPPGKRCQPSDVCGGGSFCATDKICRCGSDEVADVNRKCVKKSTVLSVVNKDKTPILTFQSYQKPSTSAPVGPNSPQTITVDLTGFPEKLNEIEKLEIDLKNNVVTYNGGGKGISAVAIQGHTCFQNSQCPVHSFCFNNACNCMNGFRAGAGYCESITKIGQPCVSSNQCEGKAVCLLGRCACTAKETKGCENEIITHPGEDCTKAHHICSFNSYCSLMSGVCECPSGMATNSTRCEQTGEPPGSACVTSRNCHKFSYCDNGYCICKVGYMFVNNFCLEPPSDNDKSEKVILPPNRNDGPGPLIENTLKQDFSAFGSNVLQTNHLGQLTLTAPFTTDYATSTSSYQGFIEPPEPKPLTSWNEATTTAYSWMDPTTNSYQFLPLVPSTFSPFSYQPSYTVPMAKSAKSVSGDTIIGTEKKEDLVVAMPGEYCGGQAVCLGNSVCKLHFCRCPHGSSAENGICTSSGVQSSLAAFPIGRGQDDDADREERQFALPLENCQNYEHCVGGSECGNVDGLGLICQCNPPQVYFEDECIDVDDSKSIVSVGEKCDSDSVCIGASSCIMGICECEVGRRLLLGICVKSAGPGDSCTIGEICLDGSICSGEARICVCPEGSKAQLGKCLAQQNIALSSSQSDAPAAVEEALPGGECDDHKACKGNSFCNNAGYCNCLPKFTYLDKTCVPESMVRSPGAQCDSSTFCSTFSICNDGVCTCKKGKLLINGECMSITRRVARKQPIQVDVQCRQNTDCPANFQCSDQVCVCHGDSTDCLSLALLHTEGECFSGTDCEANAECNHKFCNCLEGFARDEKRGPECYEIVDVNPGSACGPSRRCAHDAICYQNHCVCSYEDMPFEDHCVARDFNIGLGERCSSTYRCRQELICLAETCSCKFGDVTCKPNEPVTSPPGGSCSGARECTGGAVCKEGWCICPDSSMIVHKGICVQSGPKPTLPPKHSMIDTPQPSVPVYQTATTLNLAPTYRATQMPPVATYQPSKASLPTTQGRKTVPGSQCGPLDTCVGGSQCIDGLCVCPAGLQPTHNGRCEASRAPATKPYTTGQVSSVTGSVFSRPGGDCTAAQICTGGSRCNGQLCQCPPEKAEIRNDECSAPLTRIEAGPGESCDDRKTCSRGSTCVSGQCRCQPGYIAVSGNCIALPLPTTPKSAVYAKPLESCDNGEICEGGASCDEDTGICMCPPGQIVFGVQCMPPPTQTQTFPTTTTTRQQATITSRQTLPPSIYSTDCESDANCGENKICVVGRCKCKPGFVDNSGVCEPLEDIDVGERPVPVSYAKHKVETLRSERLPASEEEELPPTAPTTTTVTSTMPPIPPTTRAPSRQETQRPRVVGPPIRRPRPKPKSGGSGGGSSGALTGNRGTGNYKSGGTGSGNCPPGNDPTRDDSGHLITCNGLEPNCPPRSYCYITSGGFATEEYNCCKSCWSTGRIRVLKYGQPCDRYSDRCTNGAKCIDAVCKCSSGFALSPSGWCESFDLATAIANNKNNKRPFSSLPETDINPDRSDEQGIAQVKLPVDPVAARPVDSSKSAQPFIPAFPSIVANPVQSTRPLPKPTSPAPASKRVPKVLALGGRCEGEDICLNNGECIRGVCSCPPNTIRQNGFCIRRNLKYKVVQAGESCANNEICSGGAICDSDSKNCICAALHVAVNGICKTKHSPTFSLPGESCAHGQFCSGGSACEDSVCTCDSKHFPEDGYCRPIEAQHSGVQFVNGTGLRFSAKSVSDRSLATACDEANCQLPHCFCTSSGRRAPAGLQPFETPQFIVLTFDDAVNGKTFPDYKALFENVKYRNPNNCPIKGTFFVSHEWTNYDAVQWLVQQDMELASNSISHVSLEGEPASRWLNEIDGQRRIIAKFASAPEEDIIGMRAPQLALGSDEQFEMMTRAGFLYDNSLSTNPGINGEPYWPQTLDYVVSWPCHESHCPRSSFPGVWEVPLNQFYGAYMRQIDSYRRSSMIRAAVDLNNTVEELTAMLMSNFDRSYSSNRAPFVLTLNADFLQLGGKGNGMKALRHFLDEAMEGKDVYVVTIKQLIEWMQNPVPVSQMEKSAAVRCPLEFSQSPSLRATCDRPNKCMYNTPALSSSEHQFLTCSPCPALYPWLENPVGSPIY